MKNRSAVAVLVVVLLTTMGCGYFLAGTWENDPDNWERAFNSRKPDDVVVVHSKYTRFPHFTYEFEYFFHIAYNTSLHKQMFEMNELAKLEEIDDACRRLKNSDGTPEWFLPKSPENYELWRYRDEPGSRFRVFIDTDSRDMFLTDRQL